jgi:hypothetical protein
MKPATVDMLRAHLMTASVLAMGVEAAVLISLLLFGLSESIFDTPSFRWLVVVMLAGGVMAARWLASIAFARAVRSHHATCRMAPSEFVSLTSNCPLRNLVILHLRFRCRAYEVLEC